MTRKQFDQLVAEALDSLPEKYRALLENVVVLVEDYPAAHELLAPESVGAGLQTAPSPSHDDAPDDEEEDDLLMGEFIGVPRTGRALWDMPPEPARVVLYQKNIESYAADAAAEEPGASVEEIIREEVRLTVLHELGHFFGLEEDQLDDV
jgi:predicted Zn-dependent protease with MMP-like domain